MARHQRRQRRPPSRLALALAAIAVAALAAVGLGVFSPQARPPAGSAAASSVGPSGASGTGADGTGADGTGASGTGASGTGATPSPATAPPAGRVALVPIVSFWSTERSIARSEIARLVAGAGGDGMPTVFVAAPDGAALAAALGVEPGRVVELAPAAVRSRCRETAGAIGFIRAEDVTPDVRALAVDGVSLFGALRTRDVAAWPLLVAAAPAGAGFDVAATWTIAGGGDVMLDKAVYAESIRNGKGVDFPWQGGTAVIDGRVCCGWGGGRLVTGHRTGGAGLVADLFRAADLSLVNLESPVRDDFTYHSGGFSFSADPALLAGLKNAGIDGVSLANNHLGNAGTQGVLDTLRHLDELGIAHAGAGTGQSEARRAAWFAAGGQRVAVLAYSDIQPESYWAGPNRPGSAAYSIAAIEADVRAARAAGATFVIVMPHWGIEYSDALYPFQRTDAKAMVDAGADLVLASHSHWVGGMDSIDGRLVLYSLGDLVFDWTHDERTQEGAIADLTFVGSKLVQVDLRPTLILDGAQPNLLDPAVDGGVVLDPVRKASKLGW